MMRKVMVGLAVAVIATGSIGAALARGGGGMGGHGGGGGMGGHGGGGMGGHAGMSGVGHAGMSGMGHAGSGMGRGMGFGRPMGFSHPGFNRFAGTPHFGHFAHRYFAFRHHRFFRRRFAFVGVFGDDCWTRIWTRWGWQWIYVCY